MDATPRTSDPSTLPAEALAQAGTLQTVPWSSLELSSLNPRKHFDAEKIAALAESIAVQGVLQNLVVRPAAKNLQRYEIVAGASRWKAVELLVKAKRAPAAHPMPVQIRAVDDRALIEMAMTENMGRKDLTPLEEAAGFRELVRVRKIPAAEVARRLGVTERLVHQRLNLVEKLAPEGQKALAAGQLKIEHARILQGAPAAMQKTIVAEIVKERDPDISAGDVRDAVKRRSGGIPVKAAAFDLKLYTGGFVEDEDTGERTFADKKQFAALQRAQAQSIAEQNRKDGATWVKVVESWHLNDYEWPHQPKNPKAGVVVFVNASGHDGKTMAITVHPGRVRREDATKERTPAEARSAKAGTPKKANPADAFTNAHRVHAHLRKTRALRRAVLGDPLIAQRIVCLTLLCDGGCSDVVNLRAVDNAFSYNGARGFRDVDVSALSVSPEVDAALHVSLAGCPEVRVGKTGFAAADPNAAAKIWAWLCKLKPKPLAGLFAALVADLVGSWCDRNTGDGLMLDDAPVVVAVAKSLGLAGTEAKHGLTLEAADLEGLRKPALAGILAKLRKQPLAHAEASAGGSAAGLKSNIVDEIKKGKTKDLVLPTLTFSADNKAAVAALVKGR